MKKFYCSFMALAACLTPALAAVPSASQGFEEQLQQQRFSAFLPGLEQMESMPAAPGVLTQPVDNQESLMLKDGSSVVRKSALAREQGSTFVVGNCTYEIIKDSKVRLLSFQGDTFSEQDLVGTVTYDNKTYTVEEIGSDCFYGRAYVPTLGTKLELPSTVLRIGHRAFSKVSYAGDELNIVIGENIQETGYLAFANMDVKKLNIEVYGSLTHSTMPYADIPASEIQQGYVFYGSTWFSSETTSKIFIGDKVRHIPPYAFAFVKADDITISGGVETIDMAGFNTATNLTRLSLPSVEKWVSMKRDTYYGSSNPLVYRVKGVTTVLFDGKELGDTFTIPEGVEVIGANSFCNYDWDKVIFPASLKEILQIAFYECNIQELVLSPDIEIIDTNAFSRYVQKLSIPAGFKNWEQIAFGLHSCGTYSVEAGSQYLKSVDGSLLSADGRLLYCIPRSGDDSSTYAIPEGVECSTALIANNRHYSENGIRPDSYSRIHNAFWRIRDYETLRIPASYRLAVDPDWWINPRDFGMDELTSDWESYRDEYDCNYLVNSYLFRLNAYEVDPSNPWACSVDGVLYSKDKEILIQYPKMKAEESYTIDPATKHLCIYSFSNTYNLPQVTTPANLQSIGDFAFYGSQISNLNLTSTPSFIGPWAFSETPNLKSFTLDMEVIPNYLFSMNNGVDGGLEVVYLTDKVKKIGEGAFNGASELKSVCLKSETPVSGVAKFPSQLTDLGTVAFYGTGLETIEWPASLEHVGGGCFGETPWFNNQTPNQLIYFVDGELYGWRADENMPETLEIPETTKTIVANAFNASYAGSNGALRYNFTNEEGENMDAYVKTLILPSSLQEIPDRAFYGSFVKKVTIKSAERIGRFAFFQYSALEKMKELSLPSNLKRIDDYAFNGVELSEVTLPEGLESIGNQVFYDDPYLKTVTLPSTLKSMGMHSFSNIDLYKGLSSSNIETIYCNAPEPPVMTKDGLSDFISYYDSFQHLFDTNILENTKLIVPDDAIEKYRTADYWKDFQHIDSPSSVEVLDSDMCVNIRLEGRTVVLPRKMHAALYTLAGVCVFMGETDSIELPARGIYLLRTGNKTHKLMAR